MSVEQLRWFAKRAMIAPLVLTTLMLASCGQQRFPSQFGYYPDTPALALLPTGDTLTIYRIRLMEFPNEPTATLHIEMATRWRMDDTVSLRRHLDETWSYFAPYADSLGLVSGVLTATEMVRGRRFLVPTIRFHHYGAVFATVPGGGWQDHGVAVRSAFGQRLVRFIGSDGVEHPILAAGPVTPPVRGIELNTGNRSISVKAGTLPR